VDDRIALLVEWRAIGAFRHVHDGGRGDGRERCAAALQLEDEALWVQGGLLEPWFRSGRKETRGEGQGRATEVDACRKPYNPGTT
jgi:hypothetical protein